MAKRKNLNGLPHNLTKSYFGTLRYHDKGYMADWIFNAARNLGIDTITLDIINSTITPKEMEKLPLFYHLKELKMIIKKELIQNGFDEDFIIDATIKIHIPNLSIDAKELRCYPLLIDKEGKQYKQEPIIEFAYEEKFDAFM